MSLIIVIVPVGYRWQLCVCFVYFFFPINIQTAVMVNDFEDLSDIGTNNIGKAL